MGELNHVANAATKSGIENTKKVADMCIPVVISMPPIIGPIIAPALPNPKPQNPH